MTDKKNRNCLRWLYPAHCALCDTLLDRKEEGLCTACRKRVHISRYTFPGGFAPFLYRGVYRDAVRRFKYSGRAEYAAFFAEAILQAGSGQAAFFGKSRLFSGWRPDILIPVPIHRARFRERGYNQAEELAKELSRRTGIPCERGLVLRQKDTRPQNGLDPADRRNNIHNAFWLKTGKMIPDRVLLVDDIRTTGSTLAELARVLTGKRAVDVRAVCICLTPEDPSSNFLCRKEVL